MTPEIIVLQDYDGYFEGWYESMRLYGLQPKCEKVIITAGPYRSNAVICEPSNDGKTLEIDFYSALRNGFGGLSTEDVDAIMRKYL